MMPNLKHVVCRIATRPSSCLRFPTQDVTQGELVALGMAAGASDPAASTASACDHPDVAPADSGDAAGAAAAGAGAGAGVPAGVAVGTQARERKWVGMGDGPRAMVGAGGTTERMEVTAETGLGRPGCRASSALEPETPIKCSGTEDAMDEVCDIALSAVLYV